MEASSGLENDDHAAALLVSPPPVLRPRPLRGVPSDVLGHVHQPGPARDLAPDARLGERCWFPGKQIVPSKDERVLTASVFSIAAACGDDVLRYIGPSTAVGLLEIVSAKFSLRVVGNSRD